MKGNKVNEVLNRLHLAVPSRRDDKVKPPAEALEAGGCVAGGDPCACLPGSGFPGCSRIFLRMKVMPCMSGRIEAVRGGA